MRIIAVAMTKGGVGKTTTAVNLSHGLALRGHRVLLVDTDTQGQCAKALGVEADLTLTEVLTDGVGLLNAAIRARENLDLVAADHHLAKASLAIARKQKNGHLALARVLAPAADRYDACVIDSAPGFDAMAVNVLSCAHDVVAPAALTPAALAGVLDFVRHVGSVQKHNPELELRYMLPTFHDNRVRQTAEMLRQLCGHFSLETCDPIRVNIDLAEAFGARQSIFEYAPRSRGAEDYGKLVERVAATLPGRPRPESAQAESAAVPI